MAAEVTQRDLRSHCDEIMEAVARGESFVITRHGTPMGELIPLRRNRTVSREQFAAGSAHAPEIDPVQFRRDADRAVGGPTPHPSAG